MNPIHYLPVLLFGVSCALFSAEHEQSTDEFYQEKQIYIPSLKRMAREAMTSDVLNQSSDHEKALFKNKFLASQYLEQLAEDPALEKDENTPWLHYAICTCRHKIALSLIYAGFELNVRYNYGRTALMEAITTQHALETEIRALSLQFRNDFKQFFFEPQTHPAIIEGYDKKIKNYKLIADENLSIVTALIDAGADLLALDDHSAAALDYANNFRNHKIIELIKIKMRHNAQTTQSA